MLTAILGVSLYCYLLSSYEDEFQGRLLRGFGFFRSTSSAPTSLERHSIRHQSSVSNFRKERECTIYFAPSSLKGFAGYGIYTTRHLWKGEQILGGHDGLSIPIEFHSNKNLPKRIARREWTRLWGEYWWGRGVPDHVMYESLGGVVDFQIGFGFLPNHHCLLDSLHPEYPLSDPYEDSLATRFESPGSGAFSYSKGRAFTSTRDVEAGEELFMNYGYCRHSNNFPPWTKDAFLSEDFQKASSYIWNRLGPNPTEEFEFDNADNVVLDDNVQEKLVIELLPKNREEVLELATAPLSRDGLPVHLAQSVGLNRRSVEWVKENGMCLETIAPRKSTLPHAGQGGFAQHKIKRGEIIVPAPVLHIMDRDVLDIFDDKGENKTGVQLLLNYCFSNPHSTVLLCPTSNAVLINHCSNRKKQCGRKGPNADFRWSSGWDETSNKWRELSLEELSKQNHRGLSFEIYSLRDIDPGEEIFMDYGIEWENAWDAHMLNWKPPKPPTYTWVTAKEANENPNAPILRSLMIGKAQVKNGLEFVKHEYLFTGCVYWESEADRDPVYQKPPNKKWNKWKPEDIMERYGDDGNSYRYSTSSGYAQHSDGIHWPCSVFWQDLDGSYVVRIHQHPWRDNQPWEKSGSPRFLFNYPRESIHYFVQPDSSDQHLHGVFRYPITMKDDLFPKQWKNLS